MGDAALPRGGGGGGGGGKGGKAIVGNNIRIHNYSSTAVEHIQLQWLHTVQCSY